MLYHSRAKLERKKKHGRKLRTGLRYVLSGKPTTGELARQLIHVEPIWGPILRECIIVAQKRGVKNGNTVKFAGAWVVQGLRANGITPPNNLRTLSSLGLIKLLVTARSGNRAYYTITDTKGITRALKSLGY